MNPLRSLWCRLFHSAYYCKTKEYDFLETTIRTTCLICGRSWSK